MRGDRAHRRHDAARVADPRPRPRLAALPARPGDRPVHERPGLHRREHGGGPPASAGRPNLAALRTFWELSRAYPGARSPTSARRCHAPPSSVLADVRSAVAQLERPRAAARADAAADPAQGRAPPRRRRRRRSSTGWTGSSSPTTAAARWTARSRRSTRSPRSWPPWTGACPCCSTAGSAAAPTSSRRSRSARPPSASAGPTSTGSRRQARRASAR